MSTWSVFLTPRLLLLCRGWNVLPTSDSVLPPVASHVSRVLYTPVGSHKRVAFSWFLPNLKMGWPCTVIGCVALSSKPTSRPICFKVTAWSREATRWLRGTASAAAHNESIPSLLPPEVRGCLIQYGPEREGKKPPTAELIAACLVAYLPSYLITALVRPLQHLSTFTPSFQRRGRRASRGACG